MNLKIISLIFSAVFSVASQDAGPHGGALVQDEGHQFEVKIDPKKHKVSVFTLKSTDGPPKKMAITLFRESGSDRTIDLKTLSSPQAGLPKFQGELSPQAGSFVGVELRFETSLKALKILKLIPYIPPKHGH